MNLFADVRPAVCPEKRVNGITDRQQKGEPLALPACPICRITECPLGRGVVVSTADE